MDKQSSKPSSGASSVTSTSRRTSSRRRAADAAATAALMGETAPAATGAAGASGRASPAPTRRAASKLNPTVAAFTVLASTASAAAAAAVPAVPPAPEGYVYDPATNAFLPIVIDATTPPPAGNPEWETAGGAGAPAPAPASVHTPQTTILSPSGAVHVPGVSSPVARAAPAPIGAATFDSAGESAMAAPVGADLASHFSRLQSSLVSSVHAMGAAFAAEVRAVLQGAIPAVARPSSLAAAATDFDSYARAAQAPASGGSSRPPAHRHDRHGDHYGYYTASGRRHRSDTVTTGTSFASYSVSSSSSSDAGRDERAQLRTGVPGGPLTVALNVRAASPVLGVFRAAAARFGIDIAPRGRRSLQRMYWAVETALAPATIRNWFTLALGSHLPPPPSPVVVALAAFLLGQFDVAPERRWSILLRYIVVPDESAPRGSAGALAALLSGLSLCVRWAHTLWLWISTRRDPQGFTPPPPNGAVDGDMYHGLVDLPVTGVWQVNVLHLMATPFEARHPDLASAELAVTHAVNSLFVNLTAAGTPSLPALLALPHEFYNPNARAHLPRLLPGIADTIALLLGSAPAPGGGRGHGGGGHGGGGGAGRQRHGAPAAPVAAPGALIAAAPAAPGAAGAQEAPRAAPAGAAGRHANDGPALQLTAPLSAALFDLAVTGPLFPAGVAPADATQAVNLVAFGEADFHADRHSLFNCHPDPNVNGPAHPVACIHQAMGVPGHTAGHDCPYGMGHHDPPRLPGQLLSTVSAIRIMRDLASPTSHLRRYLAQRLAVDGVTRSIYQRAVAWRANMRVLSARQRTAMEAPGAALPGHP
jgi:hypothetical protein